MLVMVDNFFVDKSEYNGTKGVRITIDQSNGGRRTSFGGQLVLYGTAKKYILDKLFFGANPQTDYVTIKLFDECCKDSTGAPLQIYTGKTTQRDISVSEAYGKSDCGVSCSIVDDSQAGEKFLCLQNTIIHANSSIDGGITSFGAAEFRRAPAFMYYEETRPRSFSAALIKLLLIFITIYRPLLIVIGFATFGLVDVDAIYRSLVEVVFKARYHVSPYVHSYLFNVCKLCGLTLQSSLFDPYKPLHNMTRLDAPFSEGGRDYQEAGVFWASLNRPNITAVQFLETFKELNIGYRVTDTHLLVERKDNLAGGVWIDFVTRGTDSILELTYESGDDAQPAGEIFSYAEDQSDKVGNEAVRAMSGRIVDYNTPFNPTLRGIRQTTLQYAATRFVDDRPYTGQVSVLGNEVDSGYINFITGSEPIEKRAIISQTGMFSTPRLIMHDGVSPPERAMRETINGVPNGRLWLGDDVLATYNIPALYDLLLRINDPRLNLQRNINYTLRFNFKCEDLRTINSAQQIRFPFFDRGGVLGTVETIEIDLENREITVTGLI